MKTRNKKDWGSSALIDAVETLTSLADLNLANLRVADFDALQEGASDLAEQDHMPSSHIAANLLQNQSPDETIDLIKNTFRIILNHLQKSYDTAGAIPDPQTIESIKTIMVLAGEAAKKSG